LHCSAVGSFGIEGPAALRSRIDPGLWSIALKYEPPQPPEGFHPGTPPRKRKLPWILGGTGLALALCCGGAMIAANSRDNENAADPATDKAVSINRPARDGKFEFTVTNLKCGQTRVGGDVINETAQGEFCMIDVTVKNIGERAQTFTGGNQKAYSADGDEFSDATGAGLHVNQDSRTFREEINPGNVVKGTLVFDVPKGTKLAAVELHDSMFSGGVRVNLTRQP
jgi:hypothetical protein